MTENSQATKLEVINLAKAFGENQVLKSVSFSLDQAESLAVLGRSGTGKSVLFKCIVGLLPPDKGQIKIDAIALDKAHSNDRKKLLSKVAVVFQGSALFDSLPVWQNVMFYAMMHQSGLLRRSALDQAESYLTQVGLSGNELWKATNELSGGMQRRVAIARALAQSPDLIFFDEPTAGLDPVTAGKIDDLIASVSKTSKVTTVTITHDLSTARIVADKAMFLDSGIVQWSGDVAQLDKTNISSDFPPTLRDFLTGRTEY